jgi:hypothetical protein
MHRIDRKWIELSAGYQDIQSYKTKLELEFGRAVKVGQKLQFHKELTEWQKKRRIFFTLVAFAPLSIIALCLTSFYFRDVACVIIYWALLVAIILVTLTIAGRQYIHEMVNGMPVPQSGEALVVDLEGRWWDGLSPRDMEIQKAGKKEERSFQSFLAHSLPDDYIFQSFSPGDLLLLGPAGIWVFLVADWNGLIVKQDGIWKQIVTTRDKLGRKLREEKTREPEPDEQWLHRKQEMVEGLESHLRERAGILDLIQGGVVFSNPKVTLDKKLIQGNTASYGRPKAWVERIRHAPPVEGFTRERQLEILDVLTGPGDGQTASAKEEAGRLYHLAEDELRDYVAKLVK